MKGRKPLPIAQRIAEGDARKVGKKKLSEMLDSQPQAMRGFPPCPTHLQGLARKTWKFLVPQIEAMEMDRKPDALMLEGVCVNYARAVQADEAIADKGLVLRTSKIVGEGESMEVIILDEKPRPEVSISDKCWKNVKAFCSEFGMSPVSLTRLHLGTPGKKEDDLAAILSAPRDPHTSAIQ